MGDSPHTLCAMAGAATKVGQASSLSRTDTRIATVLHLWNPARAAGKMRAALALGTGRMPVLLEFLGHCGIGHRSFDSPWATSSALIWEVRA